MKKRLQRILSILCVLALAIAGLAASAFAENAEKVTRVITVNWVDEDNYDGLRPEFVKMTIGDEPVTVTLSEDNGWTGEALAAADASWTIQPVDSYTVSTSGTDLVAVTYTHQPKTVADQTAKVIWVDENDEYRPASVHLNILANGSPARPAAEVSQATGWSTSWSGLRVNVKGGEKAEYKIAQVEELSAYTTTVEGNVVTNTLKTGSLSLQATLSGVPEGVDVSGLKLTVTGPAFKTPVTLTYGELTGGAYDFGQVVEGAYVLQETNADSLAEGYVMDPEKTQVGDAVYVENGSSKVLHFSYAWKEPEEEEENTDPLAEVSGLAFDIMGPGGYTNHVTYGQFTDGKYVLDNLKPGTYAVVERNAEGLVRAYSLTSKSVTGLVLTVAGNVSGELFNQYAPAPTPTPDAETVDIPVVKIWNDNDNKDGNRPASVTVNLYANGVLNETHTLTANEGWAYTFLAKPRYDEAGAEIAYTVNEEPVAWYAAQVNGTYITNNYQPEVTTASVVKVWNDNENEQGIRPTSIAVTLSPVGTVYVLNAGNNWSVSLDNLPTRINGQEVTYSWAEQEMPGYVRASVTTDGTATTITNRIVRVPEVPADQPKPKVPGKGWVIFEEYDTALGGEITINHVGDCFD